MALKQTKTTSTYNAKHLAYKWVCQHSKYLKYVVAFMGIILHLG